MTEETREKNTVVMIAMPYSEVRAIVEELTPLALQLGPATRKMYQCFSDVLADFDSGNDYGEGGYEATTAHKA